MYTTSEKIKFIEKTFGRVDRYNDGNVQVRCPVLNCWSRKKKGKRKLAINIYKNDIFKCWTCGYSGRLIKVLRQYCSQQIIEEYINTFFEGKSIIDYGSTKTEILTLPNDFKLLSLQSESDGFLAKRALRYLKKRGVSNRDLWYYKFGTSKKWYDRVIMPSFDRSGNLNFYSCRSIRDDDWVIPYILPKVRKKEIVFNEININWSKELTITEGPFDMVKCNENTTILSGSDLSDDSLLLMKIVENETPVLVAIDPDMKYTKLLKQVKMLNSYGIKTRVLPLGNFGDVGDLSKKEFLSLRERAIEWDKYSVIKQKAESIKRHKF